MTNRNQEDFSSLLARLSTIALYIVLGIGLAAIAGGYLFIQSGLYPPAENSMIRNILFIIAILELAAIQFVKNIMMRNVGPAGDDNESKYRSYLPVTLVIAGMCSMISIYGMAAVFTGSPLEVLLLFVAVSLIGYQIFRIRSRDLKRSEN